MMQTDEIERLFLPISRESLNDALTPSAGARLPPLALALEVGCMSDEVDCR